MTFLTLPFLWMTEPNRKPVFAMASHSRNRETQATAEGFRKILSSKVKWPDIS